MTSIKDLPIEILCMIVRPLKNHELLRLMLTCEHVSKISLSNTQIANRMLKPLPNHEGYFYNVSQGLVYAYVPERRSYVAVGCYRSKGHKLRESTAYRGSIIYRGKDTVVPFSPERLDYVTNLGIPYDDTYFDRKLQDKIGGIDERSPARCEWVIGRGFYCGSMCGDLHPRVRCKTVAYVKLTYLKVPGMYDKYKPYSMYIPEEYDPAKPIFLCSRHSAISLHHTITTL